MLGHVVAGYLADAGFEIRITDRRYRGGGEDPLVEEVRASGAGWVVNAIGRIKQKCAAAGELTRVNTLLPLHLAARLAPGQYLLNASTDCVFSGRRGEYRTGEPADAEDDYGLSKLLGEAAAHWERCRVFRVSIIGPERGQGHGLLGWFFRQAGPVNGYTNHRWNGITTLEWAKQAARLIGGSFPAAGPVVQLSVSRPVSKCELLQLAAEVWQRAVDIVPVAPGDPVDRTLVGDVVCPPLRDQLIELRAWYEARFGPVPLTPCLS
jgi:dTDP-4-dehydrorhamnose reductase